VGAARTSSDVRTIQFKGGSIAQNEPPGNARGSAMRSRVRGEKHSLDTAVAVVLVAFAAARHSAICGTRARVLSTSSAAAESKEVVRVNVDHRLLCSEHSLSRKRWPLPAVCL
jgi:hypothetical protein